MRDDLSAWCRVRASIDWAGTPQTPPTPTRPAPGGRDGFVAHVRGQVTARGPVRAARLLRALDVAGAAADAGRPLTFGLLARWQAVVLGVPAVGFRTGPAFAKDGMERYGFDAATADRFAGCLAEVADPLVPLAARAARVYLDVSFFHPFPDGNGRAAMLAMYHVLRGGRAVPAVAGPALSVVRYADDEEGALDFVDLVAVLIAGPGRGGGAGRLDRHGPR
jgi:hypothetical protein